MNSALRIAVVGGGGHVGLPLSLMLWRRGFFVFAIDTDAAKVERLKNGIFPFLEEGGPELLREAVDGRLTFCTDHSHVSSCDVIILIVDTPVDEYLNPRLSPIYEVVEQLKPYLREGQVILLRSTLFPGTSDRIHEMLRSDGFRVSVSFCPERIAQGHAIRELGAIPQIISASDEHGLQMARRLFGSLTDILIELTMKEAELAKLFSNAWRYITFAVANQFFMLATEKQIDFYKVRDAMMLNYPCAADFPRAGFAAGPCLFKDTMQLAAFSRDTFALAHAATLVNETLPTFLVERAKLQHPLLGTRVGILGMAFKPDNDDKRESLAYKLRKLLIYEGARVLCTDSWIDDPDFVSLDKVLTECAVLFIGCPHAEYRRSSGVITASSTAGG